MGHAERIGKKVPGEESLTAVDYTYEKQKEYMDNIIRDFMENGKTANEVLEMPYNFVLDLLSQKAKPQETDSLIAAFGG